MGFSDLIKSAANKTTELVKSEIEKNAELKQVRSELSKLTSVSLSLSSGSPSIHATGHVTMYQKTDGTVFFNQNREDDFSIIDYDWNGPQYNTVSQGTTSTNTTEQTKGKSGKMATGAIAGTLLLPGVGTVVGAAVGAGGKKKKNSYSSGTTHTVTQQVEVPTIATLKLRNNLTGEIVGIAFTCNSMIDSKIKCFSFQKEEQPQRAIVEHISTATPDPYEEIKKAKELLEMGIITQEEFDKKKTDILGI